MTAVSIFLVGLLVGNEFAVAVFVHPALCRLPDKAHASGASGLARILGRAMPFWYAVCLVFLLAETFQLRHTAALRLLLGASVLWAATILVTIGVLVPISNRIAALLPDRLPASWKADRRRWDNLHRVRVVLLAAAFALLLAATVRS